VPAVETPAPPSLNQARRTFTLRERILLWLITWTATIAVRIIGPTIRFATSWEEGSAGNIEARPIVYSFWHNCIIPAMYLCRDLHIAVMTSESFDGEYIARIMHKFGFIRVRGSSSRGAVRALLGMRRELEQGWTVAFTIDGPRGPRYVAKPGPVLLARTTGVPMSAFYIAIDRAWILKTWDGLMIPKPFTRALLRVSRQIPVPPDGNDEAYLNELQSALDRVRVFAEENVGKVGTSEFPYLHRG
jgi:lysophospholipid acyltransferase (LPLAT)-like uncharacterized protein